MSLIDRAIIMSSMNNVILKIIDVVRKVMKNEAVYGH